MTYYLVKIAITTTVVVLVAELAKRSSFASAFLASVPIISVLAMIWLYLETKDVSQVSRLATSVFWLVLPSLTFFIAFPMLLNRNLGFLLSMGVSILITVISYFCLITVLNIFEVKL